MHYSRHRRNGDPTKTKIRGKWISTRDSLDVRFWKYVNKDGPTPEHVPEIGNCWEWTGGLSQKGYGQRVVDGRSWYAHRLAYKLATGTDPGDLQVCHHCDNRKCVRLEHLFLGTNQENVDDMMIKGRGQRGERQGGAVLTAEAVVELRQLRKRGWSLKDLAAKYGTAKSNVSVIALRKTWKQVA